MAKVLDWDLKGWFQPQCSHGKIYTDGVPLSQALTSGYSKGDWPHLVPLNNSISWKNICNEKTPRNFNIQKKVQRQTDIGLQNECTFTLKAYVTFHNGSIFISLTLKIFSDIFFNLNKIRESFSTTSILELNNGGQLSPVLYAALRSPEPQPARNLRYRVSGTISGKSLLKPHRLVRPVPGLGTAQTKCENFS